MNSSVVLWVLLNFPTDVPYARNYQRAIAVSQSLGRKGEVARYRALMRAEQLEHSFAGRIGKTIEPVIRPLGFDWKIGIGLLGAFAAREVFVATMSLVYGEGESDQSSPALHKTMKSQRHSDGSLVYTPLTGFSLLIFFMIALQCISTVAVVKQETNSWKWPIFQLVYTFVLAYAASFCVYQVGRLLGFS